MESSRTGCNQTSHSQADRRLRRSGASRRGDWQERAWNLENESTISQGESGRHRQSGAATGSQWQLSSVGEAVGEKPGGKVVAAESS